MKIIDTTQFQRLRHIKQLSKDVLGVHIAELCHDLGMYENVTLYICNYYISVKHNSSYITK